MKGFCPLASGSKGNCLYLGSSKTKILIDAGLSGKSIQEKLDSLEISLDEIQAILITHEHTDHIQGLKTLALKRNIPILANHETAKGILSFLGKSPKFQIFSTGETFEFGDLKIHPFSIQHDTMDPVAFTFEGDMGKIGVCTDLGAATTLVERSLLNCNYLYLEANHEPSMVHACSRPQVYKQRVLSRTGHLSNGACGELLTKITNPYLKRVYLAHLSSECNSHEVALKVVGETLKSKGLSLSLEIAHQEKVSLPVFF